jgi:voltage-gated potassium channel
MPGAAPAAARHPCLARRLRPHARRAALMFGLALAFLVLTAFALHHFERPRAQLVPSELLVWVFFAFWVLIAGEALLGYWRSADYSGAGVRRLILIWLIPPYRLALATHPSGPCIWLPQIGWQPVDRELYLRLERAFSIPMLLIAMLILPILAIEFVFGQKVASSPALALALDLGTASIWIAFAAEFIIMSALAEKKLHYLLRHWINLAIILLPLLAFLRGFQSVRLLRLSRATKLLKVYRLRGLGLRAWQGLVALELIEQLLHRDPAKRLEKLRRRAEEQEWELERLRRRIAEIEAQRLRAEDCRREE